MQKSMWSRLKIYLILACSICLALIACSKVLGIRLIISPQDVTIHIDTTQQYTATEVFINGATIADLTSSVSWSSSNPAVATISSTGLATAHAVGTTTITATNGIITDSTTLTVIAFAYITDQSGTTVYSCPVNADGSLGTCNNTTGSGFDGPLGIAINTAGTAAYITNFGANGTGDGTTVSYCTINTSTGKFITCHDASPSPSPFLGPSGIVLNSSGTAAYVNNVNGGAGFSLYCTIDTNTGNFSSCTNTGNGGQSFSGLGGITLNAEGTVAYVADLFSGEVYYCTINSMGLFERCEVAGDGMGNPSLIAVNALSTYAYIPNYNGGISIGSNVFYCAIDSTTGLFNNPNHPCADAGIAAGITFNVPIGIVVNSAGTSAYVTNSGDGTVFYCLINPSNGNFTSCKTVATSLGMPYGIAIR